MKHHLSDLNSKELRSLEIQKIEIMVSDKHDCIYAISQIELNNSLKSGLFTNHT